MRRVMDRLTRLCGVHFGPNAAAEWVTGGLLTRGNGPTGALASAGTFVQDIECAGEGELTVQVDMNGAANGDLTVTVVPYELSGNSVLLPNAAIAPLRSTGPIFTGATVDFTASYDVSGYNRVRIVVRNNNAGVQNVNNISWKLTGQA